MAARQFQRRMLSLLSTIQSHSHESSRCHIPSSHSYLAINGFHRRIQTVSELNKQVIEDQGREETSNVNTDSNSATVVGNESANNLIYKALANLKTSPRHDLAIIFTCKVCETRSVKTICRESYEKGVVVAKCGGCNNHHLIADRLGWFGEPGSVEDLLAARGEEVKKGSADTINLTLEDLAGNGTGTK